MEARAELQWRTRSALLMPALLCAASLATGLLIVFVSPLLMLAGAVGLVCAWVALKYPYYGLLFYLVLEYVRVGEIVPAAAALHPTRVIVLFTAAGWLLVVLKSRPRRIVWSPESWAVLGLTLTMMISILTAVWPGRAVAFTIDGIKTAFVFLLITNLVTTEKRIRITLWVFVILALWLSVDDIARYIRTGNPARVISGGFLGDENDLALALLVLLPMAGALFRISVVRWQRIVAGSTLLLILWGVVFTFSRGAFLGLVFVLFAMALVSRQRVAALGLMIPLLALMWFLAPSSYHARVSTISQYQLDESVQGRRLAWQSAREMFRDRPFFGVGPGNFQTAYGLLYKPAGSKAVWRAAHSVYYQCLGELGAFGCFFFGLLIFLTLRDLYGTAFSRARAPTSEWRRPMAVGIAIGLAAYLVSGAFLSALYYPHPYFLAALTVSISNVGSGGGKT